MRRSCSRPSCSALAEAVLLHDGTKRVAWFVEISATDAEGGLPVCANHAASMRLPKGWVLQDLRPRAAALFVAGGPDSEPRPGARRSTPTSRRYDDVPLPLEEGAEDRAGTAGGTVEGDPTEATHDGTDAPDVPAWTPKLLRRIETDETRAESPLLKRAFGSRP